MRKMLLVAVASGALIALTPATALAKHHSRHHRAHHARIHHKRIGDPSPSSTTPTSTTMPSPAATVTSFDPTTGMLVLTLADGKTTVSGTVTNDTRLVCVSPPSGTPQTGGDDDQGDQSDQSSGDDRGQSGGDQSQSGDDDQSQTGDDDQSQTGGDQGQGDESNQMCSTSNLTTGTPVQFAELSIGMGGANWDTVVLMPTTSPTTPPTVPDTDNDGN